MPWCQGPLSPLAKSTSTGVEQPRPPEVSTALAPRKTLVKVALAGVEPMRIFIENPGKSFTDQKHEKIDPFAYNNIIQAASVLFWTFG